MKRWNIWILCALLLLLSACGQGTGEKGAEASGDLFTTVVTYTGEDEDARYLEVSRQSQKLVALLEEKAGAFVMDAYNFQEIGEGEPLYTCNDLLGYPFEIAPNGNSIRVSKNYFRYNPIETADGSDPTESLVYDDLTLNLLVPEAYREMEDQILRAYRDIFYFEKVTAANDIAGLAGDPERVELGIEDLVIHIIYVKDGQKYFTYRADCAPDTGNYITDPVVQIYTGNIHCNYAHSFLTQWFYLPVEGSVEEAYETIRPCIEECGMEESVKRVEVVECLPEA